MRKKPARIDSAATAVQPAQGDGVAVQPFAGFVVAVGASAGGLEALENFFSHCQPDTGAAFVVIQHLSPDHKSMMHDLLGRYTPMKVQVVEDGLPIEANKVFLIPPGSIMRIADGRFQLTPKSPHLLTLPIDIFLNALAEDSGKRSIGVILSGTGSDGTRGAVAVNAAGGFLLAQDPRDAKFDGMPSSVISTGLVDAVLRAEELGERVLAHIRNLPPVLPPEDEPRAYQPPLSAEAAREGLLQLLLRASGIDFHDYKPATVMRRIERRMQVVHARTMDAYLTILQNDPKELATLRRELLIPVTSFFRDVEAYDTLAKQAVTELIARTLPNGSIRVWVAGTSTGEEAYSIAMLFLECFERERRWPQLKLFATDVNQHNIEFGAAGQYPESAAAELTPERLERFFIRTGAHYTVRAELRQCIVFAKHNLLADPPFTRMGLVSCRNTLIYFGAEAQRRALYRLQYAIQPEGFLFLGSSESLAGLATGFATLHGKHKLFRRTGASLPMSFSASGVTPGYVPGQRTSLQKIGMARPLTDDLAAVDEAVGALMSKYAPPSMLVNQRHEVVHLFGKVRPYFQAREGSASLGLNRLLPDKMLPVASALLYKAAKENEDMVSDVLRVPVEGGGSRLIRLRVQPLQQRGDERLLLLSFEEQAGSGAAPQPQLVDVAAESVARIDILERELAATRESLQATIEELETSNEELQATNEELMAANEELQSSNEELQSINEELNTVNAEYQEKVSVLNQLNIDLDTMAKAVGVATIFVDRELRLTRYSPDALKLFKLRETDLGRPIDEVAHVLRYPALVDDLRQTIASGRMIETTVQAPEDRLFNARLLPYGERNSGVGGAVATFIDISDFRDRQRLQAIIDALPEHIAVLEHDGTIALVNAAWNRFARANGDPDLLHTGVGSNYLEACQHDRLEEASVARRASNGIKSVLEGSSPIFSMEYPCHSPSERRWFLMSVSAIHQHEFAAVVSHVNITAWYDDAHR
jgi:two-component system CheB/CheR fusion protein